MVTKIQFSNKKDQQIYDKTRKYLEKISDSEIDKKMEIISKVLEIKDKEEKYSYLYDLICDYLDNEFRVKNICGFDCGICKRRKDMIEKNIKKDTYENGCCYRYSKGKACQYLIPGVGCSVKNIGCKTFTCSYLKKRGFRYRLKDIYLARYFFNYRQRYFIENTFFVDKDDMMKEILRRG